MGDLCLFIDAIIELQSRIIMQRCVVVFGMMCHGICLLQLPEIQYISATESSGAWRIERYLCQMLDNEL